MELIDLIVNLFNIDCDLILIILFLYGVISVLMIVVGDVVQCGFEVVLIEVMKLEYVVMALYFGMVFEVLVSFGEFVVLGQVIVFIKKFSVQDI